MPKKTKTPKILWAIDAFFAKPQLQQRSIEIIDAWNSASKLAVEPVVVVNDVTEEKSWAHPGLKKGLDSILKTAEVANLIAPKIVRSVKPPFTNRKVVAGLVKYSESQNCQLLVVNSSTNKNTLARMAFGSFAETLILTTKQPVLLISSQTKKITKIKTILFATDFSNESKVAYKKVLRKAHSLGAKVTLFHQMEFGSNHAYRGKIDQFKNSQLVSGWVKLGSIAGVPVKVVIKGGVKNKAESVIEYSKKTKIELIALVSRSGPVSALLLGSTTRQLARRSEVPIWILHPKKS